MLHGIATDVALLMVLLVVVLASFSSSTPAIYGTTSYKYALRKVS